MDGKGIRLREELRDARPKNSDEVRDEVRDEFIRRVESERKEERVKQGVLPDMEL